MAVRKLLGRLPALGPIAKSVAGRINRELRNRQFPGSRSYWEQRYAAGGHSGAGSFKRLARYKAEVLNAFVVERSIVDVIELGCGDGNQLALYTHPKYIGLDASKTAIGLCSQRFSDDRSKSFFLYDSFAFTDNHQLFQADLSLSIDVIYHLIEDDIFDRYMRHLFAAARRYVIVYSSDFDSAALRHQRNRKFTAWVKAEQPDWRLEARLPNPYPYDPNDADNTSLADFFIFTRA